MTRSSTHRRTGAALALAVGTAAATVALPATTAHADPTGITDNCDLSTTVGELAGEYGGSNVIVFREDRRESASFDQVVTQGKAVAHGCQENDNRTYVWVVFDGAGEFVRSGDGGYRNWAFQGVFDRPEDQRLEFQPRG